MHRTKMIISHVTNVNIEKFAIFKTYAKQISPIGNWKIISYENSLATAFTCRQKRNHFCFAYVSLFFFLFFFPSNTFPHHFHGFAAKFKSLKHWNIRIITESAEMFCYIVEFEGCTMHDNAYSRCKCSIEWKNYGNWNEFNFTSKRSTVKIQNPKSNRMSRVSIIFFF